MTIQNAPSIYVDPTASIVAANAYSAFGGSSWAISVQLSNGDTRVIHCSAGRNWCEQLAEWLRQGTNQ